MDVTRSIPKALVIWDLASKTSTNVYVSYTYTMKLHRQKQTRKQNGETDSHNVSTKTEGNFETAGTIEIQNSAYETRSFIYVQMHI